METLSTRGSGQALRKRPVGIGASSAILWPFAPRTHRGTKRSRCGDQEKLARAISCRGYPSPHHTAVRSGELV